MPVVQRGAARVCRADGSPCARRESRSGKTVTLRAAEIAATALLRPRRPLPATALLPRCSFLEQDVRVPPSQQEDTPHGGSVFKSTTTTLRCATCVQLITAQLITAQRQERDAGEIVLFGAARYALVCRMRTCRRINIRLVTA